MLLSTTISTASHHLRKMRDLKLLKISPTTVRMAYYSLRSELAGKLAADVLRAGGHDIDRRWRKGVCLQDRQHSTSRGNCRTQVSQIVAAFIKQLRLFRELTPARMKLAPILGEARSVFVPRAIRLASAAQFAIRPLRPMHSLKPIQDVGLDFDLCPTEEPDARPGWPPLPGDFYVLRYGASGSCLYAKQRSSCCGYLPTERPEGLADCRTFFHALPKTSVSSG